LTIDCGASASQLASGAAALVTADVQMGLETSAKTKKLSFAR